MPVPSNPKKPRGPQQQCFDRADDLQHNFFVSKQFIPKNSITAINSYKAFETVHHFLQYYDKISKQYRNFMELIRDSRPCLEYYDIEWELDSNTTATTIAAEEQPVLCKLQSLRNEFAPECPVKEYMCRVSSASSISKQKGSLHVVVFKAGHAFHNNHTDMKAFMLAFKDYITIKESTDSDKRNGILNCIDWLVYTRNRLMRCLGSAKCEELDRPFVRALWHAASVDSPAHEFFITNVPSHLCLVSLDHIANIPKNLKPPLHRTINTIKKHELSSSPFELEAPESSSAR
ncbi:hypothetical protein BGZ76_004040, partial [Entomortierella beljakovae]